MKSIEKIVANVPKVLRYRAYPHAIYTRVENDIQTLEAGNALSYVSDIYALSSYLYTTVGINTVEGDIVIMDAVQIFLNDLDK